MDYGIAKAFLFQQFLDSMDFRQEPGDDHHLVAVVFRAIQQIRKRIQLSRGNLLRDGVRVIAYKAARQLG